MTHSKIFKFENCSRVFSWCSLCILEIFINVKIFHFLSFLTPQNSESLRGKLIKKWSFCTIFGTDLFFDTISSVQSEEISRYALGAEILQFENCFAINFEFLLSGARTEGGGIVAPAVDRQPGLRREDSLGCAHYIFFSVRIITFW